MQTSGVEGAEADVVSFAAAERCHEGRALVSGPHRSGARCQAGLNPIPDKDPEPKPYSHKRKPYVMAWPCRFAQAWQVVAASQLQLGPPGLRGPPI